LLSEGNVRKAVSRYWEVGKFHVRKTQRRYGGDREQQDPHAWRGKPGKKQKVHSLIDKVYSRKNLELAWEKVKKNRGQRRHR
jgi:hypothetical protein